MIEVEFGAAVDGRGEIFVALDDHDPGRLAEANHDVEAFQLRPHHVVGLDAAMAQHMEYHRRGCGLAVAAADDDAELVFRLLVKVFGIAVDLEPHLLCLQQLRIVGVGMHSEHHGIKVGGYPFGMPALVGGQQPCRCQTAAGRVEYLVVRPGDIISFLVQGQRQVVHGTAADGNKMYFHCCVSLSLQKYGFFLLPHGFADIIFSTFVDISYFCMLQIETKTYDNKD